MNDFATSPAAGDVPAPGVATDDVAASSSATEHEAQAATEGDPEGQPPEDDGEDIEHDGKTYRVPKELKDAFLRQSDYTQKTQTVAEQRRALEAEQARVQQMDRWTREHAQDIGKLVSIDEQLAAYNQVNWQAESARDPVAAQAAWFAYQQLKDGRGSLVQQLQQRDAARDADAQREHAKRLADGHAELAKAIPGWGADMGKEIAQFGVKTYNLTPEEVSSLTDPRFVRVLRDAQLWQKHQSAQRAAAKPAAAPAAAPVTVVGGRRAYTPPSPSSPASDRLATDSWMKARNEQVAKANRR